MHQSQIEVDLCGHSRSHAQKVQPNALQSNRMAGVLLLTRIQASKGINSFHVRLPSCRTGRACLKFQQKRAVERDILDSTLRLSRGRPCNVFSQQWNIHGLRGLDRKSVSSIYPSIISATLKWCVINFNLMPKRAASCKRRINTRSCPFHIPAISFAQQRRHSSTLPLSFPMPG